MKATVPKPAAVVLALLSACDGGNTGPKEERFSASLSGQNEQPAAISTSAAGSARFVVDPAGRITYSLDVQNVSAATMAHIHGPADATRNAGVLVWLADARSAPVSATGTTRLGEGTIDASVALPAGVPYDSLLAFIRTGRAYVNVHTNANKGGEIRGQILPSSSGSY